MKDWTAIAKRISRASDEELGKVLAMEFGGTAERWAALAKAIAAHPSPDVEVICRDLGMIPGDAVGPEMYENVT